MRYANQNKLIQYSLNSMSSYLVWMTGNKQVIIMAMSRDGAMIKAENTHKGFFAVDAEQTTPQSNNPNA
jgi:hypothetical protein